MCGSVVCKSYLICGLAVIVVIPLVVSLVSNCGAAWRPKWDCWGGLLCELWWCCCCCCWCGWCIRWLGIPGGGPGGIRMPSRGGIPGGGPGGIPGRPGGGPVVAVFRIRIQIKYQILFPAPISPGGIRIPIPIGRMGGGRNIMVGGRPTGGGGGPLGSLITGGGSEDGGGTDRTAGCAGRCSRGTCVSSSSSSSSPSEESVSSDGFSNCRWSALTSSSSPLSDSLSAKINNK